MKLHPRLSRATCELVTRFETFQPQARPAAEGGWTIGYGHTRSAREGASVTRVDADALLLYDLDAAACAVEQALFAPVAQREFEALTAFCFNIGADNFRRSTALAAMNAGMALEAADEIERWRRAELGAGAQVVDALVRRRAAEKAHFLGLPEGFAKSPSAVLRPLAGDDAVEAPGARASATLTAANTVQARLRELVPEPPEPAHDPATAFAPLSEALDLAPAAEPEAPPFPDIETGGPRDEPHVSADVDPVPPEPANDVAPPPLAPPIHAEPYPAPEVGVVGPTIQSAPPGRGPSPILARAASRFDRRTAYALLAGVGVCLFVVAAILILGGKPGLSNLALGVTGALLLAPGVYGLLGPQADARPDRLALAVDQPPDSAA